MRFTGYCDGHLMDHFGCPDESAAFPLSRNSTEKDSLLAGISRNIAPVSLGGTSSVPWNSELAALNTLLGVFSCQIDLFE